MAHWFDPRTGQIVRVPDPPAQRKPAAKAPPVALPKRKDEESSLRLRDGSPAWVVRDGVTHWNPELLRDHTETIGLHEAAHCVAGYLLGREIHSAQAGSHRGLTLVEPTDDPFDAAATLVAGEAFERSIGLSPTGSFKDIDKAIALLRHQGLSGRRLDEACRVVEEAALELVRSERFQRLAFALGPVIARDRYVGASQIRRILLEADPKRPVERHSVAEHAERPWYEVTSRGPNGRLLYRGPSHDGAKAVQRQHPGSLLVGSLYG